MRTQQPSPALMTYEISCQNIAERRAADVHRQQFVQRVPLQVSQVSAALKHSNYTSGARESPEGQTAPGIPTIRLIEEL